MQVLVASLDLVGQRVAVPLGAATVAPLLAVVGNVLSPQANQISSIGVGSITVRRRTGWQCLGMCTACSQLQMYSCSVVNKQQDTFEQSALKSAQ